jgi:beta-lactamase regulating signal transducer with metallopeptidase domain
VPLPASAGRAVPALVVTEPARLPVVDRAPASLSAATASAPAPRDARPAPLAAFALLWVAGVLGVLLWSAFGHLGLWALLRSALPVERTAWARLYGLAPVERGAGARVRLAHSSVVGTPLTWGWIRPIVLLPSRSAAWPLERRRVALLHELAHVERGDYLSQLAGTLVCAVYWFHPLVWWAAGRLRSESEHACDDRVLAAGTTAPAYASDLLAVAHGARGPSGSRLAAIGMARRTHLEGRLLAVLDESRRRGTVGLRAGLVALAGTLPPARPLRRPRAARRGSARFPERRVRGDAHHDRDEHVHGGVHDDIDGGEGRTAGDA